MEPTPKTRKPIDHLTTSDFLAFPVWEYALDEEGEEGRDETWVRPLNTQTVPLGQYSLQVAADFRAASGQSYSGFVDVTTAEDKIDIVGGVLLHRSQYLFIHTPPMFDFAAARAELLSRLEMSDADLFPMTYTLRVLIDGEQVHRTGVIT